MLKITVLSARYGFLDSRSPIQNYGTHFTGEFADRMMGGGLGHAGHGRLFPQAGQFRDRRGLRDGFAQGAWRSAFHRFPLRLVSVLRSEEHQSELQSLMRTSYAVFCLTQ